MTKNLNSFIRKQRAITFSTVNALNKRLNEQINSLLKPPVHDIDSVDFCSFSEVKYVLVTAMRASTVCSSKRHMIRCR